MQISKVALLASRVTTVQIDPALTLTVNLMIV